MQQFSNQDMIELRSRVDRIHDLLVTRTEPGGTPSGEGPLQGALTDQLSLSIRIRRMRKSHFGDAPMAGPVWDMMLDLMQATSSGRTLSASDLATGAGVPLSSGLRMIASLEAHGLVVRSVDARDRRRSIVHLTDRGRGRMARYFEKMAAMLQSSRNGGDD